MATPRPRPQPKAKAKAKDPPNMRMAHRTYGYNGCMSAFDASLRHYLRIRTPERSMELLDLIIWSVVNEECNVWASAHRSMNMALLLRVIGRIDMDQAMWDFVGIALFIAAAYSSHVAERAISSARAISARVLPALLDQSPVHAMRLTWDRMHDLAIEWLQRSPAAYQIGRVCGMPPCTAANLTRWVQTVQPQRPHAQGAQRAWDSAIHRRMQRNAHDAQNELRRDRRIAADTIGLIAQFLAPPSTTQAQLKRQRDIYATTIQIARLCVQARVPDLSFDAARDLQHQADLARGALIGQPGVAVSQTLLPLHRMPTASARARDEGEEDGDERHSKRQRTSESPV